MYYFTRNRKANEVHSHLRRLCDLTLPNHLAPSEDRHENRRIQNRYNRTIPAILCPWVDDHPLTEAHQFVTTHDLADDGISLVARRPLETPEALAIVWLSRELMEEPWFLLARVRHQEKTGGGFWSIGVELTELAHLRTDACLSVLNELATELLPPAPSTTR